MIEISVIICTHNPRRDYLERALAALKAQTLPKEQWELLLVDNASKEPLAGKWDLSWQPEACHIREGELGLTLARLCGIRKSRGELIIFVDDDNLLAPDYLSEAKAIAQSHGFLGSWGAGVIEPEFESQPPPWLHKYHYLIALKKVTSDRWSNLTDTDITLPCGAGLCVRRKMAEQYAAVVASDMARRRLGRIGSALGCSEDLDLALTATDSGLGTGLFVGLKMKHIMPAARLQENYLLKLAEGNSYSGLILAASRGRAPQIPRLGGLRAMLGRARRFLTMRPRDRRFFEAGIRGQQRALIDVQSLAKNSEPINNCPA